MARANETGEYVIGYIAIDKPWYSNPKDWNYYIIRNDYQGGGICGSEAGGLDVGVWVAGCGDAVSNGNAGQRTEGNEGSGVLVAVVVR